MTGLKKKLMHKRPDHMTSLEENLLECFDKDNKSLNGSVHPFFKTSRQNAIDEFRNMGIPGRKSEAYKYTDLGKSIQEFDNLIPNRSPSNVSTINNLFDLPEIGQVNMITFVNGMYREELSEIVTSHDKLIISPLEKTVREDPDLISNHFGSIAKIEDDAFIALNTAFSRGGILIQIKKNQQPNPIIFRYFTDTTEDSRVNYSRNLILTETGSECTIIEQYAGANEQEYLLNSVNEVSVAPNSGLNWYKIQDHKNATQINQLAIRQQNDSRVSINTCITEGKVIRNNILITLDGENCETHLYGTFLADETMHVDNQTVVDHRKPHCLSNELYKGILDDEAHAVFNGKVFVRPEAQKTNAFQSNKNILLSDSATINTKPQLEIWADDVKCSHGCTTGQLDDEAFFYLRSRGLDKHSAKALLLYAFALESVSEVKNEGIKKYLEKKISDKLNYPFT